MIIDKTITWGDSSTEDLQVSDDFIVSLDGVAANLIGMCIQDYYPGGQQIWSAEGLAFYDKELAYLESIGVRTVQIQLPPVGDGLESARMGPLLDLCYDHKMLVFALISCIYYAPGGANCLTPPNFTISTYDVEQYVTNTAALLATYDNIICISADNELDQNLFSKSYSASEAATYVAYMVAIIKTECPGIPVTTKLVAVMGGSYDAFRLAMLPEVDLICFDMYVTSSALVASRCNALYSWLATEGYTHKAWISEFDARDGGGNDYSPGFTPAFAQAAITGNMVVQYLWTSYYSSGGVYTANKSFFSSPDDIEAEPTASLVALALVLESLQGIVPEEGGGEVGGGGEGGGGLASVATFYDVDMAKFILDIDERNIDNDIRSETEITETTIVQDPGSYGNGVASSPFREIPVGGTLDQEVQSPAGLTGLTWLDAIAHVYLYNLPAVFISSYMIMGYSRATYRITNTRDVPIRGTLSVNYTYLSVPVTTHEDTNQITLQIRSIDAVSIAKYGRRTIPHPWALGQTQAQMQAIIDLKRDYFKEWVPTATMTIKGKTDALIEQIFTRREGEKIRVISVRLGMDANFYINSVDCQKTHDGLLEATYALEAVRGSQQYTLFQINNSMIDGVDVIA